MSEGKNYIIDVDLIIESYNNNILEKHAKDCERKAKKLNIDVSEFSTTPPNYVPLDRASLAEKVGLDYQVISKYSKGKVPKKMLKVFLDFEEISGLKLNEFVKEI